jgi:hypothetical protein
MRPYIEMVKKKLRVAIAAMFSDSLEQAFPAIIYRG